MQLEFNQGYHLGDCYGVYKGRTACKRQYMFDVFLYDQKEQIQRAYYKRRCNSWVKVDKEKKILAVQLIRNGLLDVTDRIMFYDDEAILRCGKIQYINAKTLTIIYLGKTYIKDIKECFSYELLNDCLQERQVFRQSLQGEGKTDKKSIFPTVDTVQSCQL